MSLKQLPLPFKVKKGLNFYSKITEDNSIKLKQDSAKLNNDLLNQEYAGKRSIKRSLDGLDGSSVNDLSPTKRSRYSKSIENHSPKNQKKSAKIALKINRTNKFLQNASNALHGSNVSRLPGRENELSILENFLLTHFNNEVSGSLYISGPPGTGKTASLSFLLDTSKFKDHKIVYVNCAALKSASSIYQKISQELKLKIAGKTEKAFLTSIERYLESDHKMILLVLDEIDQLDSKRQSVLYSIFDWPARPSSNLILIGIANALDLTDRMLPRLQKKLLLRPKLLHFPPYTKEQIVHILTARLSEAAADVFSPVALQLLAAKVAALSGDVRRALDLARLVIEATSRKDSILSSDMSTLVSDANTTVEVKQVLEVLDSIYGSSKKLETDIVEDFPLQQKLLICSLLLMVTKGKTKDITVGRLYEVYSSSIHLFIQHKKNAIASSVWVAINFLKRAVKLKLDIACLKMAREQSHFQKYDSALMACRVGKKRNISVVDSVEFPGLCELVQTRGIIKLSGRKEPRMCKISLHWDENEILTTLKDKMLISDILNDLSCLSR